MPILEVIIVAFVMWMLIFIYAHVTSEESTSFNDFIVSIKAAINMVAIPALFVLGLFLIIWFLTGC